jgi:hypothetical protein
MPSSLTRSSACAGNRSDLPQRRRSRGTNEPTQPRGVRRGIRRGVVSATDEGDKGSLHQTRLIDCLEMKKPLPLAAPRITVQVTPVVRDAQR